MPSITHTPNKTEQRELDRHAALRQAHEDAFAAVESTDGAFEWSEAESRAIPTKLGEELQAKRDQIGAQLHAAADKLRKRGYTLTNDDSAPVAPAPKQEDSSMTTTEELAAEQAALDAENGTNPDAAPESAPEPAAERIGFEWPKPASELLLEYLTENVSSERNAPNEGLPFITEGGVLRIRAEHWRGWLTAKGIAAPKMEAGRPIRELGFAMKPFALPGEDRSHGFYTGPAPKGTEKLPRRILERAAGAPRAPKAGRFGRFDAEALGLLKSAVANYPKRAGGELRTKLLAELEQASDALAAAAAAQDAE